MKYLQTFENRRKFVKNDILFVDKLEQFFNEIKLRYHSVTRFPVSEPPQAVQICQGKYGKFSFESNMFYENDGEKDYPFLDEYISSKVPGSYSEFVDASEAPRNVIFSKEEYEIFKETNKYNL